MSMKMRMRMSLPLSFTLTFLVDSYFIYLFFLHNIKMSYYWFITGLQKAKERYSKEKAAEYCKQNKEVIKEVKKSL